MNTLLYGFVTGLGLIVAIGAQNVFVLRRGVARQHVFAVASTAALCDTALIILGVAGLGGFIASLPWLATTTALGGALFLIVYGFSALHNAFAGASVALDEMPPQAGSAQRAVGATLAVSLLNPHVYLDTVVLLGGIGGQLAPGERLGFALGAVSASVAWFFGLAYGARALAPLFRQRIATRLLDLIVALIMFSVAGFLVREVL